MNHPGSFSARSTAPRAENRAVARCAGWSTRAVSPREPLPPPAALDAFLREHKVASLKNAGSSLKLCLVASGEADLYPRLGRTMEWDIAAGHAVIAAAGGRVTDLSGAALRYGKPGFENPHFVAMGLTG